MSQIAREFPDNWEDIYEQMRAYGPPRSSTPSELPLRPENTCPECDGPEGSHAPFCQIGYEDSFWCQNEIDRRLGK